MCLAVLLTLTYVFKQVVYAHLHFSMPLNQHKADQWLPHGDCSMLHTNCISITLLKNSGSDIQQAHGNHLKLNLQYHTKKTDSPFALNLLTPADMSRIHPSIHPSINSHICSSAEEKEDGNLEQPHLPRHQSPQPQVGLHLHCLPPPLPQHTPG